MTQDNNKQISKNNKANNNKTNNNKTNNNNNQSDITLYPLAFQAKDVNINKTMIECIFLRFLLSTISHIISENISHSATVTVREKSSRWRQNFDSQKKRRKEL